MSENPTPEAVAEALNVSRETLERLETYVGLIGKWQNAINLIGKSTTADIWQRHVLDCGQLWRHMPESEATTLDLGSGAGLPGLVLAILGMSDVHLIEADTRKCVFLREAARVTATAVTIHEQRIEHMKPVPARYIVSRALAPLGRLLNMCEPHIMPNTKCLFLKGKGADTEIKGLSPTWEMKTDRLPSLTSPECVIVLMESLRRVDVRIR